VWTSGRPHDRRPAGTWANFAQLLGYPSFSWAPYASSGTRSASRAACVVERAGQRTRNDRESVLLSRRETAQRVRQRGDVECTSALEGLPRERARSGRGQRDDRAAAADAGAHLEPAPPRRELQRHPIATGGVLPHAGARILRRRRSAPRLAKVRIESRRKARHPRNLSDLESGDKLMRHKDLRRAQGSWAQAPSSSDLPNCDFPVFFAASNDRAKRANQPRGWGAKPRAPREIRWAAELPNFRDGSKERPGRGLAAGLSRSTVSVPSPGGRADPGVRAPPTRRATAGSHPSERTLDHAPNGTQHASDSRGAHEPAARLPPRVEFRAQGDVRRFHSPVQRSGAGGCRRWCTLARPWGRAREP